MRILNLGPGTAFRGGFWMRVAACGAGSVLRIRVPSVGARARSRIGSPKSGPALRVQPRVCIIGVEFGYDIRLPVRVWIQYSFWVSDFTSK